MAMHFFKSIFSKNLSLFKVLLFISLAFWVTHSLLRVMLLFRSNPYGFPFVSKPDWYIFHAVCLDFLWIINTLVIFVLAAGIVRLISARLKRNKFRQNSLASLSLLDRLTVIFYAVFHAVILVVTLLDHELQRFLGTHLSFGLVNTYKDTSSIKMFWDYVANDYSVPFLQFIVLALMLPLTYAIYRLLNRSRFSKTLKPLTIFTVIFYVLSFLFIHYIWTGNARMTKLRPVTSLVWNEILSDKKSDSLTEKELEALKQTYQNLWFEIEGDTLWEFSNRAPLLRLPKNELLQSEKILSARKQMPNFLIVFLESQRAMNVGHLNSNRTTPSPTPFLDSLAAFGHTFERMHTSGLPTTGGILSSHIGIPHHSKLAQATDLAHVHIPSFASVLSDSGYATHYFSAADPAWDNLSIWVSKWYQGVHYDRSREDDSVFFDHATTYVLDTLSKQEKPFLATFATRSNHYPFNFAGDMPEAEKQKPLAERINYTMHYADRQLARFMRAIENQEWFKNTFVIVLADHGFPLGENGISTMNGGGFSNATWIPFVIKGPGLTPKRDTVTAAQIDLAPTILELAGIVVPNMFMGHNLLRETTDSCSQKGLSLGAYPKAAAIGVNDYRLISKYPLAADEEFWLFAERDSYQTENLATREVEQAKHLKSLLDSLIQLSDYALEQGWIE